MTLTSVIFDYGTAMKNILAEIANGVKSGEMPLSMANGAVYLADCRGRVSEEVGGPDRDADGAADRGRDYLYHPV